MNKRSCGAPRAVAEVERLQRPRGELADADVGNRRVVCVEKKNISKNADGGVKWIVELSGGGVKWQWKWWLS